MKSLNTNANTEASCPFDSDIFTQEIIDYILSEGFEWKTSNDSYGEHREGMTHRGCYKQFLGHNYGDWLIYAYICEDGIEVDNDYDCGGNASSRFFEFEDNDSSFEETYDKMVDYINELKTRG